MVYKPLYFVQDLRPLHGSPVVVPAQYHSWEKVHVWKGESKIPENMTWLG